MASIDTNRPAAGHATGIASGFFAQVTSAFTEWNEVRRTRAALSKLTARELDDIGLNAGDIDRIAKQRVR